MTPRVDAWLRQARTDLAFARHARGRLVEDLQATGVTTEELSHLRLNVLSRMITATRYPSGDEAPSDLFDEQDARECLAMAEQVVTFVDHLAGD